MLGVVATVGSIIVLVGPALGSAATASGHTDIEQLSGTFTLDRASCRSGRPTGSWLAVTYGTKLIQNHDSSCDHGAYTLLQPGTAKLTTAGFSPTAGLGFDSSGRPATGGITASTEFNGHGVDLVSASDDLQDAPEGPATFAAPTVYVTPTGLDADLRSIQALYDGPASMSCRAAEGQGCWTVGAERAIGSFNRATRRFTFDWFSGQSFAAASAGLQVHLAGTFHGSMRRLPVGANVELGTQSFAVGTQLTDASVTGRTRRSGHPRAASGQRPKQAGPATEVAASESGQPASSPIAFLIGELLIAANALALLGYWVKRSTS